MENSVIATQTDAELERMAQFLAEERERRQSAQLAAVSAAEPVRVDPRRCLYDTILRLVANSPAFDADERQTIAATLAEGL
jgi:hypothetical protein